MNALLATIIIVLTVIAGELWWVIQRVKNNPFFNYKPEPKVDIPDPDPLFEQAAKIGIEFGKVSAALLQRRLSIGYARASKLLDRLAFEGYIGPADGLKPRIILKNRVPSKRIVN